MPFYKDPKMEEYFLSLPTEVRAFIISSGREISTPGELMMVGEHFKMTLRNELHHDK